MRDSADLGGLQASSWQQAGPSRTCRFPRLSRPQSAYLRGLIRQTCTTSAGWSAGEELAASGAQLDLSAQLQAAGSGVRGALSATWDASGGCGSVTWPRLTSVVVLGVGPVDIPSVSVTVRDWSLRV